MNQIRIKDKMQSSKEYSRSTAIYNGHTIPEYVYFNLVFYLLVYKFGYPAEMWFMEPKKEYITSSLFRKIKGMCKVEKEHTCKQ